LLATTTTPHPNQSPNIKLDNLGRSAKLGAEIRFGKVFAANITHHKNERHNTTRNHDNATATHGAA